MNTTPSNVKHSLETKETNCVHMEGPGGTSTISLESDITRVQISNASARSSSLNSISSSNSNIDTTSFQQRDECVVCGRTNVQLSQRSSGYKCKDCIGISVRKSAKVKEKRNSLANDMDPEQARNTLVSLTLKKREQGLSKEEHKLLKSLCTDKNMRR
eukprot:NODE_4293_length_1192_cov_64.939196_g3788_i0.p2 GENE.NODE_4293_length_1192_cov_64.939196_g3788_i0~~NODE_4293_length_1192_cov_64.939196_g3788_i0.p2  ORF type:complete len:158 (-),score=37.41 NODE_4293_length_1192_cov_64.939196_g3788_i0:32-505(-)